jgi:hypothetical protein
MAKAGNVWLMGKGIKGNTHVETLETSRPMTDEERQAFRNRLQQFKERYQR